MQGHRNNFRRKKAGSAKVWFARTVPVAPSHQGYVKKLLAGQD
jgi:hypothetical protein